ncbi:MAG: aspartate kinase [Rikenellaceae bacterium]|nr:aspartate kinase [Rikenellaceae bacterium]
MKVYKFGGASVKSAEGVRNLKYIIEDQSELFIIISAMGKTTNALENVLDLFYKGDKQGAADAITQIEGYHATIMDDLFGAGVVPAPVAELFAALRQTVAEGVPASREWECWYDALVSYGELISTRIISEYLNSQGVTNRWIDMRRTFVTDGNFKYANVDLIATKRLLDKAVNEATESIYIGQGFIGATHTGETTTLGREGSDYSAAVVASVMGAESLAIWKDVIGVLNADPKIFDDAQYIPELTYLDAIELAYSGAQIIHPKTIKPLQNSDIPLYVRPFGDKFAPGTVIKNVIDRPVEIPIRILKRKQVVMSIQPNDFSFVLEERLAKIFTILEDYNIKVNLIETSAIKMSLCVDNSRHLPRVIEEFNRYGFTVAHNEGMELLTIRGYTEELLDRYIRKGEVMVQRSQTLLRIVRPEGSEL